MPQQVFLIFQSALKKRNTVIFPRAVKFRVLVDMMNQNVLMVPVKSGVIRKPGDRNLAHVCLTVGQSQYIVRELLII